MANIRHQHPCNRIHFGTNTYRLQVIDMFIARGTNQVEGFGTQRIEQTENFGRNKVFQQSAPYCC